MNQVDQAGPHSSDREVMEAIRNIQLRLEILDGAGPSNLNAISVDPQVSKYVPLN